MPTVYVITPTSGPDPIPMDACPCHLEEFYYNGVTYTDVVVMDLPMTDGNGDTFNACTIFCDFRLIMGGGDGRFQ